SGMGASSGSMKSLRLTQSAYSEHSGAQQPKESVPGTNGLFAAFLLAPFGRQLVQQFKLFALPVGLCMWRRAQMHHLVVIFLIVLRPLLKTFAVRVARFREVGP